MHIVVNISQVCNLVNYQCIHYVGEKCNSDRGSDNSVLTITQVNSGVPHSGVRFMCL